MNEKSSSIDGEILIILKDSFNNFGTGSPGIFGRISEIGEDYVRLDVPKGLSFEFGYKEEVVSFDRIKKIYSFRRLTGMRK